MKVIVSARALAREMDRLRRQGKTVGFVPTMGALHDGHLSLIRRARRKNNVVVVSIFVNPIQFGHGEDFTRYPRPVGRDKTLCLRAGVDYIFMPRPASLYPKGFGTFVEATELSRPLCGAKRPGHFRGVTTVVAKLFNIVKPHAAYFGAKDYQQAVVVRRMARDLNFDIKIEICPIIRERDGVAMSSRNVYLSPEERRRARSLSESLRYAWKMINKGERSAQKIKAAIRSILGKNVSKIDYVEIVRLDNLTVLKRLSGRALIALACFVGRTRLIDNVVVKV
ncbi:MAG: pantoate--beta-alanine ligase [Candidatus Omnitrophica bacterium]|nr:pantoate--beta-alanine ligase [Candidatus Omnitrophota bacterium]